MRTFWWVSGRLTEMHHFIDAPARGCQSHAVRERRELWLTAADGTETQLVVHSRHLPARRGHDLLALMLGGQLVGVVNISTGMQINYRRSDPDLLWRHCDSWALVLVVVLMVCVAWRFDGLARWAAVALALLVPLVPLLLGARLLHRFRVRRQVDRWLDVAKDRTGRPLLRRVK